MNEVFLGLWANVTAPVLKHTFIYKENGEGSNVAIQAESWEQACQIAGLKNLPQPILSLMDIDARVYSIPELKFILSA